MKNLAVLLVLLLLPLNSWAWGRRGHQIVGENAAIVVATAAPHSAFMRAHSFDFGYYANVPDFGWKRPATYAMEKPEHFMDLEIFNREFAKHPEIEKPFELNRKEFEAKFPDIKPEAGRSFWRIRELYARLEKITAKLKEMKEMGEPRHKVQAEWLVTAGTMAHYVGDLGMPLHVSENYDGQMSGQKGVHGYFEEVVVDELYPEIGCEVHRDVMKQFPEFAKKHSEKSVLELLLRLADISNREIPHMLAIDKKGKREDLKKMAAQFHDLIRKQMVEATLTLAELYRRQLDFTFDSDKFFTIVGEPEYIKPGE